MRGEQPQRVRQLRLRSVDAARDHVQDEVDAFGVRQPVAGFLGGEQRRQQVIAGLRGAAGQQRLDVVVDLSRRLLQLRHLRPERLDVELPLNKAGPVLQLRGVGLRCAEHGCDGQRGVRLGDRGDELAAAAVVERTPQATEERAHRRPPAIGGPRRERAADQGAQPPVVLALLIEDVRVDLLAQPPARHAEQVGDLAARKRRRPRSQEELGRLAVEHDVGQRRRGKPAVLTGAGQARELLVVGIARQIAASEVDAWQVKL